MTKRVTRRKAADTSAKSSPDEIYLRSGSVRRRLGDISEMTLWRLIHGKGSDFPKPTIINRLRYWRLSELEAWEQEQKEPPQKRIGLARSAGKSQPATEAA